MPKSEAIIHHYRSLNENDCSQIDILSLTYSLVEENMSRNTTNFSLDSVLPRNTTKFFAESVYYTYLKG